MKVLVFTPDTQEPIGIGDLCRYTNVKVTDDYGNILFIAKRNPVIVMEDGEIYLGVECWWMPL